ncbi:single-stranded DNA-binding protein [Lewinella sp. IMCC34183]|uniref:single-stranded DNA-binding protein n=1 Tax=Lewinella sp. IMCC34183 TaxID=2248762 RepID=UPI000E2288D1|nr:single-stranded DNA-binding protein [Lewinella sp. IMCC34183]
MNVVNLIGTVAVAPVYHCSVNAYDLVRLQLITRDGRGERQRHHCLAFGPAALSLHAHLAPGNQLLVRGELRYRFRGSDETRERVPYVLVRGFSFLDGRRLRRSAAAALPASG